MLSLLLKEDIHPETNYDLLEDLKKYNSFSEFVNSADIKYMARKHNVYMEQVEIKIHAFNVDTKEAISYHSLNQHELNFVYTVTQHFTFSNKTIPLTLYRGISVGRKEYRGRIELDFDYIVRIIKEKKITTNLYTSFTETQKKANNFRGIFGIAIKITEPSDKVIFSYRDWLPEKSEKEYTLYNTDILDVDEIYTGNIELAKKTKKYGVLYQ